MARDLLCNLFTGSSCKFLEISFVRSTLKPIMEDRQQTSKDKVQRIEFEREPTLGLTSFSPWSTPWYTPSLQLQDPNVKNALLNPHKKGRYFHTIP